MDAALYKLKNKSQYFYRRKEDKKKQKAQHYSISSYIPNTENVIIETDYDSNTFDTEIEIYYLLYKIKNTDTLWIVKHNEDLNIILENHKKIKDTNNEDYIIIKKLETYYYHFKQFCIFLNTDDCKIVYDTQLGF